MGKWKCTCVRCAYCADLKEFGKVRPVLPLPWELNFTLRFKPNEEIQEAQLKNIFELGGRSCGYGTFRGMFGKFAVAEWE